MAGNPARCWRNFPNSSGAVRKGAENSHFENWHGLCKVPGIAARMVRPADHSGSFTMFASFQARQILVSVVGALVFAGLAITTAAPIFPIA
jgi:hypothetical protein